MLHQRRDKGGNTHNFPFDTLTKVYRDSMYASQDRYLSNPMYPERGPHGSSPPSALRGAPQTSSSSTDVTNHVGNIGVMSAAATPLSEWMEELHHEHNISSGCGGEPHDAHQPSHGSRVSASPASANHTRIVRSAPSSPLVADGGPAASTAMGDEAVRERLRARIFASSKGSTARPARGNASTGGAATAAAAAAPRHSGVQVEILNVYRSMLREVRRMEDAGTRRNLTAYIRSEFDKHRDVPRKNILKIEWQLNYGKRKLEDLQAMGKHTRFTMMR